MQGKRILKSFTELREEQKRQTKKIVISREQIEAPWEDILENPPLILHHLQVREGNVTISPKRLDSPFPEERIIRIEVLAKSKKVTWQANVISERELKGVATVLFV